MRQIFLGWVCFFFSPCCQDAENVAPGATRWLVLPFVSRGKGKGEVAGSESPRLPPRPSGQKSRAWHPPAHLSGQNTPDSCPARGAGRAIGTKNDPSEHPQTHPALPISRTLRPRWGNEHPQKAAPPPAPTPHPQPGHSRGGGTLGATGGSPRSRRSSHAPPERPSPAHALPGRQNPASKTPAPPASIFFFTPTRPTGDTERRGEGRGERKGRQKNHTNKKKIPAT